MFLERVTILEEYDRVVRSARFEMKLPSVVSLKTYIRPARKPAFTRFNVFLRDQFECQYCGDPKDLTFDHVIPRSKGGRTTWENVVTACSPCNLHKGGRMPSQAKMHPRIRPHQPTVIELREHGRKFPPNYLHESPGRTICIGIASWSRSPTVIPGESASDRSRGKTQPLDSPAPTRARMTG